ncbi:MAG: winged helix-turn-helix domain-containing protein [Candidatus Bathyarchaeia archaeon]|jgi:DNA-binding transcriptional ArsR family regulator
MSTEDDTYSSIFTALKHPIRRKILRILDQSPTTYTEIQKQLEIDNGLLNYHLENMKDLVKKGEDGRYVLSEIGRAALGVTVKVEEPTSRKKEGISIKLLIGIILVLVIATASLSELNIVLFNSYQSQTTALSETKNQLTSATTQLNSLIPLGELANLSEPATLQSSGIQIVSDFPMSYTYLNLTATSTVNDYRKSIITFYVPSDGAIVHLELQVDPVNVYELDLTLQKGNAWRNDTRVNVGTVGSYFNLTNPLNPRLSDIVWRSPVLWSVRTEGNGMFGSPTLSKGWYTFSLFGPIVAYGPRSVIGTYVRASYFEGMNPDLHLQSYNVFADFSIHLNGKPIFFDVSSDRS